MSDETRSLRRKEEEGPSKGNGHDLFKAKDPQQFEVSLRLDTWESHILRGHPEMNGLLDAVKKAIIEPEIIQESPRQPTTYYYYRLLGRKVLRRNDLFVLVVVEREDRSKTGFVKTAHLVDKLRRGEKVVWFSRK